MDSVTASWFDDSTVTVTRDAEYADFMSDAQIARIAGAPRHSTVHIYSDDGVVAFEIRNAVFKEPMYRYLIQNLDGHYSFHLKNVVMVLREEYANRGIGTRCVVREIYEAARWVREAIVITHIDVSAVGNRYSYWLREDPLRGYSVWANLGFDGLIPPAARARLDAPYRRCSKISELVDTTDGRDQWRQHGETVDLSFDLRVGSGSWRQLRKHMKRKGIMP